MVERRGRGVIISHDPHTCTHAHPHSVDQQYRFLYFNEMNLAVKSPLLSRRLPYVTITADAMRLLTEVNKEYDRWVM